MGRPIRSLLTCIAPAAIGLMGLCSNGASYSLPWYADDKVFTYGPDGHTHFTWSVVQGTNGLGGPLRTWMTDPFEIAAGVTPS